MRSFHHYYDQNSTISIHSFFRAAVHFDMIGAVMQAQMQAAGREFVSRSLLLNPDYCEKLQLPHQYIKFLLDHGIVITRIHSILEFPYASRPYELLCQKISERRQAACAAGADSATKAAANGWKLTGNAFYGTSLTNVTNFNRTSLISTARSRKKLI